MLSQRILQNKALLVVVFVVLLAMTVRISGLGEFMTVDEAKWMVRSGEYWHKLFRNGDVGGTFVTTHPGATLMWISGAGIAWQETRLGFDIDTSNLRYFREAAVWPVMIMVSLLIGLNTFLAAKIFGWRAGAWGGLLLATEPYLVGMGQVAHLDMLLALFMLAAALAWLLWQTSFWWGWLVLGGAAGGLAMATKLLPAIYLPLFLALAGGLDAAWRHKNWKIITRGWFFTMGCAALAFYIAWPALWVKTGLRDYYERDTVNIVTKEHVVWDETQDQAVGKWFYLRMVAARLTPFTLIIAGGLAVAAARNVYAGNFRNRLDKRLPASVKKWGLQMSSYDAWALFIFAGGYGAMISLAAKKADRYALPMLAALVMAAGVGFALAAASAREIRPKYRGLISLAEGTAVLLLVGQVLMWAPHAIAYNNWLDVRSLSQQGWGEGLEQAAEWLNRHPLAEELTIASWYPSVMETYFSGKTMSLSSRHDGRVGFLVTYRNMGGREGDDIATNVLEEVAGKEPVKVVYIQGNPYVWIYEQIGLYYFTQHVGEITGGMEVGQTVVPASNNWSEIEIGMATFSSRNNTKDIIFHVRERIDSDQDIRTVVVNAGDILDSEWQRFKFEPIPDSQGQEYYIAVTSPDSVIGDAVTIKYTTKDILSGDFVWRRDELVPGVKNSNFVRAGDLAYRLGH